MNPPRPNKPLLVLDLDRTLLHFSRQMLERDTSGGRQSSSGHDVANSMKRPYMDQFLTQCYVHWGTCRLRVSSWVFVLLVVGLFRRSIALLHAVGSSLEMPIRSINLPHLSHLSPHVRTHTTDLVVWSQTSWRWLETKLIELGMLSNPGYKFCFVLDKTSMFTITSTRRSTGKSVTHHVKPLQLIWSKFPDRWSSKNTCHIDDLGRNFALNLGSGIKVTAFDRKKAKARRDVELLGLGNYLEMLAKSNLDFDTVDFESWRDVVAGNKPLS